jgi:hypothetical protein
MEPAEVEAQETVKSDRRSAGKIFLAVILFILFANVLLLDYIVGNSKRDDDVSDKLENLEKRIDKLTELQVSTKRDEVEEKPKTLLVTVTPAPTLPPQIIEKETVVERIVETESNLQAVKEFYIPLGQASVKSDSFEWKDTGAEAQLDLSLYGNIKSTSFEATLSAPSGQVEVRLYNVSDEYEVGGSRMTGDGSQPKLYKSGNLSLPGGTKTYRVQMRTTLQYWATMDNSRIRIITQ